MNAEPPFPPELAPDWLSFIERQNGANGHEFDLQQLRPGDWLRVVTQHTTYDFRMLSEREATLRTGRDDRPSGLARILGCTFGQSSSIKPDHLFCGGNLKFVFQDGEMTLVTTSIREIHHWSRGDRKET
ncbi:MAG: hypothetical protein HY360_10355 [Verrucomicrobia bacterium]|nr:hypothetical protein [Verrucomicrobiota bacterium]